MAYTSVFCAEYKFTGVVRHLREGRRFRTVRSRKGESVIGFWDRGRRRISSVLEYHSFIRLSYKTRVVYHLLGKTVWSAVVVNGMRQIPNGNFHGDVTALLARLSRKIGSIQAIRSGTSKN